MAGTGRRELRAVAATSAILFVLSFEVTAETMLRRRDTMIDECSLPTLLCASRRLGLALHARDEAHRRDCRAILFARVDVMARIEVERQCQ
jgi:hypothetical protein